MNKLFLGIAAFAVLLLAGAVLRQHQSVTELRKEIGALRADVQRLATSRTDATMASRPQPGLSDGAGAADPVATSEQRVEIAKLRAEIKALASTTQEAARQAQAASQVARGESPIPVKLIPSSEWRNVGRTTVNAAVETVLWAAVGGDVEALTNSIVLDESARAKAEALMARLPEATRAEYGSPEKLISLFLAKDAAAATGMQILGQRDLSAEVVGVRIRVGTEEGKTSEQNFGFRRSNDGLRLIINDKVVDKYARQLAGGK